MLRGSPDSFGGIALVPNPCNRLGRQPLFLRRSLYRHCSLFRVSLLLGLLYVLGTLFAHSSDLLFDEWLDVTRIGSRGPSTPSATRGKRSRRCRGSWTTVASRRTTTYLRRRSEWRRRERTLGVEEDR